MLPCDVCDEVDASASCKCKINSRMIPGLRIVEARLLSPADLNLSHMAGDQRIPADYGPDRCNTQVPIHTYGRPGNTSYSCGAI